MNKFITSEIIEGQGSDLYKLQFEDSSDMEEFIENNKTHNAKYNVLNVNWGFNTLIVAINYQWIGTGSGLS